jgi:hypothetical protein
MSLVVFAFLIGMVSAQDVPPPPRADSAGADAGPIMRALERTLLSAGQVEWGYRPDPKDKKKSHGEPQWRQKVTKAVARDCILRLTVEGNMPWNSLNGSFFLESVVTGDVMSEAHLWKDTPPSGPLAWGTAFNEGISLNVIAHDIFFPNKAQAKDATDALNRAIKVCQPVVLNAKAGAPGIAETMQFIEDKLMFVKGARADVESCQIKFEGDSLPAAVTISFRRVEKIEVLPPIENSPNYRLLLTTSIDSRHSFEFGTEELVNRVAKAMTHAAELCGGGRKDPF